MKLNYGDIKADREMAGEIEALGVRLGRYDETRGRFVASYPDSALAGLKVLETTIGRENFSAFTAGKFDASEDGDLYADPSQMDQNTLYGHVKYLEFRIATTHERDHIMTALREKLGRVEADWKRLSGPAAERETAGRPTVDSTSVAPYYDLHGRHYSERIIDQLIGAHQWQQGAKSSSARKTFASKPGVAGRVTEREYVATFDDLGRYLTFAAGWRDVFDIEARDRDIAGVAREFDMRAVAWAERELNMPVLPAFAQTALGRLGADSALRTGQKLDELLDAYARSAGQSVDPDLRANVHHTASGRFEGFKLAAQPTFVVVSRDADGQVTAIQKGDKTWTDHEIIDLLESGRVGESDSPFLVGALEALGVLPGRAFDKVYGGQYSSAASDLREVRETVRRSAAATARGTDPDLNAGM